MRSCPSTAAKLPFRTEGDRVAAFQPSEQGLDASQPSVRLIAAVDPLGAEHERRSGHQRRVQRGARHGLRAPAHHRPGIGLHLIRFHHGGSYRVTADELVASRALNVQTLRVADPKADNETVVVRTLSISALTAVTAVLAACGGSSQMRTGGSSGAAVHGPVSAAGIERTRTAVRPLSPYSISLPPSSRGPTTCTVYETDYATQIVVDSRSLNVRAECELWSANQPGVGYLWGYEQAAVTRDVVLLCTLTDPHGKMTVSVIEDTGFIPVSAAQRAKGGSACAGIRASGWTVPSGRRPRPHQRVRRPASSA